MRFDRVYDANEEWLWDTLKEPNRIVRALCVLGGYKIGVNWAAHESYWLVAPNGAYKLIYGLGVDAYGNPVD